MALKKLGPEHKQAIRLRIEGKKPEEIAKILNRKTRTIHLWASEPIYKEELERQLTYIERVFAERMAEAGLVGLEQLVDLVQMPVNAADLTPSQKLQALGELLDRAGIKRTQDQPQQPGGTVNVYTGPVANLSDEKLRRRALELSGGVEPPVIDASPDAKSEPAKR